MGVLPLMATVEMDKSERAKCRALKYTGE